MYERILVPLDGSELAEGVLPYVKELAEKLKSEVILFTIAGKGDYFERPLRAYLEKRANEFQELGVKASPMVIQGDPAIEILDFSETNDIGLIIISTHGHTGPSVWNLGNVARKVLQKSTIPIIMINSSGLETVTVPKEQRKILLLLDGSQFAESIIPYVENLAEGIYNDIFLLRVVEPIKIPRLTIHAGGFDWKSYEKELAIEMEQKARHYLERSEKIFKKKGMNVHSVTLTGRPAHTILQYVEDNSVNLIALATHGFSGITKWAYGSVASKIIEGSSRPIMLVRPALTGVKN